MLLSAIIIILHLVYNTQILKDILANVPYRKMSILNTFGNQYFGLISIGSKLNSKKSDFTVLIDSGSDHFWLPSDHVLENEHHSFKYNHHFIHYNQTSYNTAHHPLPLEHLLYGSGSVFVSSGPTMDTLYADFESPAIELAESESPAPFDYMPFDGILGLSLKTHPAPFIVDFNMRSESNVYFFNHTEQHNLCVVFFCMSLASNDRWMFEIERIDTSDVHSQKGYIGLVDTGSSKITMHSSDFKRLNIPSTKVLILNLILVNGKKERLSIKINHPDDVQVLDLPGPVGKGVIILGDVFLRQYAVLFDSQMENLGFLEK